MSDYIHIIFGRVKFKHMGNLFSLPSKLYFSSLSIETHNSLCTVKSVGSSTPLLGIIRKYQ